MTPASVPNEPQNSQALPSNNLEEIPTSNDTASTSAAAQVADERKALIKRSSEEQRIVSAVVTAYQKQQETVLSCLLDLSDDSRREMAKSFKNITEQHPFAPRPSTESQTVMSCVRDRGQRGDLKRLETLSGSYQDFCRELLTDTIVNQHTDLLRILTNAVSEKKKLGIVVVDEDKAQIELNDFHKQCEGFFEEMFRIAPVPIVSKTNVPAFSAVNRRYIPMENLASDAASSNTPAAQTPREEESPSSSSAPTAPAVSTSDVQIEEKVAVPATASSSTPAAQTPIPKEKLEAMQERYRNNHALFLQMYSDFKLPPFHNMYCVADELGNMPLHYFFEVYGGPTENRGQAEVLQMILDQRPALNRQNQNHLIPLSYARDPQSALCPVLQAWFKEQAEGLGLSSNELCRMLEGGISAISSNNLFPIIEELIDLRILTDADRHNNRNLVKFIEYVTACFSGKLTSMKTNPLKDSKPFLRDILGILEAYEKANKENAVPLDEVREEDRKKIEEARRQHRLDYQLLALSCLNILEREAKKENTKETEDRLAYLIFDLRNTSLPSSFIYEHSSFIFLILRRLFSDFRPSTFGENAVNPLYGSDVFSSPEDLSHAGIRHLNMNTAVIETHRKFNAERARHDQDWRERFDESEREHERKHREEIEKIERRHQAELEQKGSVATRRLEEAQAETVEARKETVKAQTAATEARAAAKQSEEHAKQSEEHAKQSEEHAKQSDEHAERAETTAAHLRKEMDEKLGAMAEKAEAEVMQARLATTQIQKEMEEMKAQARKEQDEQKKRGELMFAQLLKLNDKLESMKAISEAQNPQGQAASSTSQDEQPRSPDSNAFLSPQPSMPQAQPLASSSSSLSQGSYVLVERVTTAMPSTPEEIRADREAFEAFIEEMRQKRLARPFSSPADAEREETLHRIELSESEAAKLERTFPESEMPTDMPSTSEEIRADKDAFIEEIMRGIRLRKLRGEEPALHRVALSEAEAAELQRAHPQPISASQANQGPQPSSTIPRAVHFSSVTTSQAQPPHSNPNTFFSPQPLVAAPQAQENAASPILVEPTATDMPSTPREIEKERDALIREIRRRKARGEVYQVELSEVEIAELKRREEVTRNEAKRNYR